MRKLEQIKRWVVPFAFLLPLAASAQETPPSALGITHAATSVTPTSFSVADLALIENRAKIFKDRLFAATNTIYAVVKDRDVAGKTSQQEARILAGPSVGKGVQNVVSVVDVDRPVAVAPDPKKGLNIGAVTLTPAAALKATSIDTTTYVSIPNLRLVKR